MVSLVSVPSSIVSIPSYNSLHAHRARNSGFPSAVEQRTNGRIRYVGKNPSQKFEAVHKSCFGQCVFCVLFLQNLLFSFSSQKYKFNDQWQEFHQNHPLQGVFWDDMRELFLHTYLTMTCCFCLETKSQTQQNWGQEEILAGHVCELAHRTKTKTGEVGTCW